MWKYTVASVVNVLVLVGCVLFFAIGSSGNLSWVKERAEEKWQAQGFDVVDYEGYQFGSGGYGLPYGGAKVWYRLVKRPDNGITYSGCLVRWGDELHVYGPKACDAIQP